MRENVDILLRTRRKKCLHTKIVQKSTGRCRLGDCSNGWNRNDVHMRWKLVNNLILQQPMRSYVALILQYSAIVGVGVAIRHFGYTSHEHLFQCFRPMHCEDISNCSKFSGSAFREQDRSTTRSMKLNIPSAVFSYKRISCTWKSKVFHG